MSLARCGNGHMFNSRKYGNTCPYCDIYVDQTVKSERKKPVVAKEDSDKTMPYWEEFDGTEPVVGWIVCIEGAQRGQSYPIRSEKNFIGRSEEMHIQITGDNAISRRNHAVIIYDPMKRNFFLNSGDASGLVYHNNEVIYLPVELSDYDVIQMGKSKFLFISLCGIHFAWENGNDNKKEA